MKRIAILCTVLALAPAASAASPTETVTVTATRPTDQKKLDEVVGSFVDQHAALDPRTHQLVRDAPNGVCPLVEGLPQAYDDLVQARIVAVANQIGSSAQDLATCRPNVEVFFSNQPQTIVDKLVRQTRGNILGFHWVHDTQALQTVHRPVEAWYITGSRFDGGVGGMAPVSRDPHKVAIDTAYGEGLYTGTGSHLRPRYDSRIVNVLIVADTTKVGGLKIGPISDYIALLSLAKARSLDACTDLPSITDLLASSCDAREKPETLTAADFAYLKALYAADLTATRSMEREDVDHGMAAAVGGQN